MTVDFTLSHVDKIENVISFLKLTHYFSFHISTRPFISKLQKPKPLPDKISEGIFSSEISLQFHVDPRLN